MLKHSLLQLFRRHFTQRTANPCRKRLRHMDQKLDHLEDRTLLASFIVNSEASDGGDPQGGVITLRGAIDLANGNPGLDQITFSPSVIRIADGFSSVITDAVDIDGAGKVTIPSGFLNHGVLSVEGHTGTSIRNLIFEQRPGRGSIVLEGGGSHTVTGNRFEPLSGGFGTRVGVEILSSDGNQIGGNSAGDRNVFVGLGIGVRITEDTSAKTTSEGNFITGNLIGVKADGTVQANSLGIELGNSKATTIEANVISGNGTPIVIQDVAIETKVTNNRIGLAAASETAVPNFNPVTIAGNNSVVSGNVISGNFASGILISGNGNKLTGNKIGTNSDGSAAIPNEVGVEIIGKAATNEVGPGNVIVANASSAAVEISVEPTDSFLDGNSVEGNTIGLNSGQTAKLGGRHGILVRRGTGTVIIENVIGGLSGNGIVLLGQTNFSGEGFVVTDTFITDNTIGLVSPDGPILGNLEHGILIGSNVDRTTIGSTEIQPGDFSNDISFSGKSGIRIEENKQDDGTIAAPGRHAVNGNLIFDNGGLPIDTGVPGVNPQDVPDSDGFLNQPVIRSIREGSTIVQGELNVASGKYVLEFFDALGGFLHRESLTIVDPIADRTFSVTIPGNFEEDVSATLTRLDADLNGTTSESADIRLLPVDLKIKGTYESDNNFGGVDRGETIPSGDQINVISLPVGSIHQYTVEVVNRDDEARVIQLNAQVDDVEGWIPQFFVNLSPITSQITGAGFKTALLQPGESQIVIVEIESQNTSENGLPVIDEGDLFNVTIEAKVDGATPFETVDAVQAVARAGLFVNSSLDAPDADLDDGVPDADPNMKGQQLTLRSAIQFANTIGADPNSNARLVVGFELAPNDGVITILSKTHGPLPIITSNLSIDGTELIQPGPSEVKIFGQEMNENEHGLHAQGASVTIMGLTIGGFGGHGIFLDGTKDSLVSENILGFDQFGDGTGVGGNSGDGLHAQSAVNLSITGNVIGFNQRNGIHILDSHPSGVPDPQAPNVKIRGNAIGHHEGVSMTNDHNGILIENSSSVLIGGKRDSATGGFQIFQDLNLISHNGRLDLNGTINGGHGVLISGSKSTSIDVQGNFIGTDHTGLSAKGTGNFSSGVAVINGANDVRIGGVSSSTAEGHPGAGLGNVISGNQGFGIEVTGEETTNVRIQGNLIGLLADGTFSSSGNQKSGVLINQANFVLIGTSSVSTTPDFRSRDSLSVSPTGNVITGNGGHGVLISNDANENFILENVIGLPLESTGKGPRISLTAVGNQGDGIRIDSGAFDNQVGDVLENNGKSFARGNLIFANGGAGIRVDGGSNTEILGNKIGGLLPGQTFNMGLGNKLNGIVIENSFGNRVGISASSLNLPDVVTERLLSNQIVANGFGGSFIDERHGVLLRGTSEDDIAGNSIGDPRHGIPNAGDGLHLNGVDRATIFDNDVTFNQGLGIAMISTNLDTGNNLNVLRGNRVFANDQRQILLLGADTRFNVLAGNQIGPIDALQEFGERFVGLELDGAQLNTIGGRNAGDANLFVGTQHGILIHNNTVSAATAVRNGILGNNFLVTDLPIDLRAPGDAIGTVTNNDLFGDNDDGPNGLQNHPVITSVQISEGPGQGGERTVLVQGFLESVGEEFYLIEFYTVVGETRFKIGEKIVGTNSSGVTDEIPGSDAEFIASFQTTGSIAPGVQLAATASRFGRTIDPNNFSALTLETSEFSAPSPGAVTASDQDLDGVLDAVESADANNDGIPDDLQRNVAVIPGQAINFDSFVQNQVVNLADVAVPFVAIVEAREQGFFRNAAVLGNLNRFNEALPSLSPDAKLAVQVPFGFEVELAEGEKFAIVRFRIPGNIQANRFVKFQQAPSGDPQLTFFDFDQFAGEGATFSVDEAGNTVVTLFVEDNGAFDFNPEPGVVLDPGLPVRQQVLEFISDGSTDLNLVLRKFGDDLQILNKATNSVVASRTLADTRAIFVTGTDERNDTLTIDFSTGIFELPDFLRFDGGDGTGLDNLRVIGGKFDSSTYTAIGTHNGEIQLDGLQVLFTGVETAREETTVDNRAFQIANDLGQSSTTDLTIRIADVGSSSDKLMTIDDGGAGLFRGLTFTLPVNRLEVISAGANDTILFVSSDQQAQGHLIIDGRAGDDVIDAGGLTGNAFSRVTLIGGMGNDQLFGSAQKDILFGGTGNDDLTGRQGNDILNGNDGDDTFRINSGDGVDDINTGLGNDVVLRDGIPSSLTGDDILFFDESSRTFQLGTNIGNQFSWAQSGRLPANIDTFIGDFDGDGDLDAAFLNLSTRNINLLTNNAGSFSLPQLRGKMASAGVADHFHVLDMDGDGIEEILYQYVIDDVIESPVNFNVTGQLWTKSLLPGGIQDFKIRAQVGFASFAVGDFNGDLRDDLVGLIPGTDALANPVTNLIPFISVNAGGNLTAVLGAGRFSAIDLRSPMTADLNGDGRDDLIVQSTTGQILHATTTGNLRGILTGVHNFVSSSRAPNLNPNSYIPGFLLGTINDDRFADLVAIESNQANFFVGRTSLNGSFLNPSIIGLLALTGQGDPTHEFKMGDFNSDGFDDLVGLGDIVEVFLSNPSTNLFGPGLNFGPGPASS